MVSPSKPRIEDLLAQSTWVRALARRLAANSGEADDLTQETWVAALRTPPTSGENLRGWLTRVLQNLASSSRRAAARRARREEWAARPEAQPSVAELHERAQVHREVVQAVLDLEEPYGSTVLLRYFEGLPPRIIAARQGVPLNTVRTRLSRGLATLRSRLEHTHGDGRGWASALLPLTLETHWKTHPWLGALLMNTQAKIAGAVIVVAVTGTALWRTMGGASTTAPPGPVSVGDDSALERPPNGPESVPPALGSVLQDPVEPQGRTLVAAVEPAGAATALVSGRLLLRGGGPAAGARLVLHRQESDEDSDRREDWVDLTVDTDDEGRFEFRFLPPRVHQLEGFKLDASYPGQVPLAWNLILVQAGSRVDLGTVTFAEPGRIAVRIVDLEGMSLVDGWIARAEAPAPGGGSRDSVRVWGVPDRATDVVRLEGVPAGEVSVSASHRMGAKVEEVTVTVRPWEETSVTLFYDGPDLARRITVGIFVPRVVYGVLDGAMLRLEDGLGGVRVPTRVENVTNRFTFDGLEPGLYTVRVEDPRFEPWSRSNVRPGEYVEARPVGNAAVRLRVVDARTGEPVVGAEVWGDLHDPSRSRTRFDLPEGTPQDDGSMLYAGLVPASFDVVARASGYPEASVAVEDLVAGEERQVTVQLVYTPPLVGRVVQSDGHTPAANVRVQRTLGSEPGWKSAGPVFMGGRKIPPIDEVVSTDQEGVFRFEGLPATRHALRAVQGRWLDVSHTVEWPADADQELLLVLPPYGRLEGRILVPPPRSAAELVMWLRYRDHSDAKRIGFIVDLRVQGGELAADGSFVLGPLPTGVVSLWYKCGDFPVPTTGVSFELGEVTIRAGETTRALFDERERFPGKLRIRVYVDGERQKAGRVGVEVERNAAWLELDSRDEMVFDDATPGPWHVGYSEPSGRWSYRSPEAWLVRPGGTTDIELQISLQKRSVLFVDPESGAPLRQVEVAWRMGRRFPGPGGTMHGTHGDSAITDDEGRLTLTLPASEIRFYRGSPAEWDAPHAEVPWSSGATYLRVELPDLP